MLKKRKPFYIITILFLLLFLTFINPNVVIYETERAINIFIYKYFPTAFIIFIIGDLLINYNFHIVLSSICKLFVNKVFHVNQNCIFAIIMSCISGFVSGSKYTTYLLKNKLISIEEANYLIAITHFSNPLYILGTCNLVIDNYQVAIYVLISHFIANIIMAIIIRPKKYIANSNKIPITESKPFISALSTSILSTFRLLSIIFGISIIFFIISKYMNSIIKNSSLQLINTLFLDINKGISMIPNSYSVFLKSLLILIFLSFGSISVHMQVLSIIKDTNIKYKNFLLGRISQTGISILIFIHLFQ